MGNGVPRRVLLTPGRGHRWAVWTAVRAGHGELWSPGSGGAARRGRLPGEGAPEQRWEGRTDAGHTGKNVCTR